MADCKRTLNGVIRLEVINTMASVTILEAYAVFSVWLCSKWRLQDGGKWGKGNQLCDLP